MDAIQVNQNVKHKFFDKNKINNHSLILYIGRDEISYAIINDIDCMVVFLKSLRIKEAGNFFAYKLSVKDFFEQEELLKARFKSVSIGINAGPYTLIPTRYFEETHIEKYYSLNYPYDGSAVLRHDHIGAAKTVNIYSIDSFLLETINATFSKYTIKHATSYLLEDVLSENVFNRRKVMYLNVQKHNADVIGLDKNNLVFTNTYYYQTPDDFLYYALNTAKQINFDPYTDECVLLGEVTEDYQQYEVCHRYISDVKFGDRPGYYSYCDELSVLPTNYHYNLFCIH